MRRDLSYSFTRRQQVALVEQASLNAPLVTHNVVRYIQCSLSSVREEKGSCQQDYNGSRGADLGVQQSEVNCGALLSFTVDWSAFLEKTETVT